MTRMDRGALLAALLASGSVQAQTFDAATAFGAREEVTNISLSPDGKTLALVRTLPAGGEQLETVATAGGVPKPLMTSRADQRITGCLWASSTRVICSIYAVASLDGTKIGSRRQMAVDANGGNPKILNTLSDRAVGILQYDGTVIDLLPDGDSGEVLMTKAVIPEDMAGTRIGEQKQGVGVEQINTATMRRKLVEQARVEGESFITDGHGKIRVIGDRIISNGQITDRVNYCYRPANSRDCKSLSVVTQAREGVSQGFYPVAIDREQDAVYGFDKQDGRQALFRMALDGSMKRELVLANPRVDVDGLVRIGRQRRVVGVSYADEARETQMFDPALAKLAGSLSRALPGGPTVAAVDASLDESKLLIRADSDTNPGRYYLYDKGTRELNELVSIRPPLDGIKLATVKPVSFPAADGTMIPGYLTLPPGSDGKNLPAIVMPHGGPGARDELGFDWWAQYFANRGFAVLQPNYRGSTGYGDAWFQKNGFQSWRTAIGDVNDGGRWLQKQGIAGGRQAGDRRLVLRRLCRAAIVGAGPQFVQGDRGGRAGYRSRDVTRRTQEFHRFQPGRSLHRSWPPHPGRFAGAECRRRSLRRC